MFGLIFLFGCIEEKSNSFAKSTNNSVLDSVAEEDECSAISTESDALLFAATSYDENINTWHCAVKTKAADAEIDVVQAEFSDGEQSIFIDMELLETTEEYLLWDISVEDSFSELQRTELFLRYWVMNQETVVDCIKNQNDFWSGE